MRQGFAPRALSTGAWLSNHLLSMYILYKDYHVLENTLFQKQDYFREKKKVKREKKKKKPDLFKKKCFTAKSLEHPPHSVLH